MVEVLQVCFSKDEIKFFKSTKPNDPLTIQCQLLSFLPPSKGPDVLNKAWQKKKKWVPFVDFYFVKGWLLLLFEYFIPFQISFHKLVSRWTCFNISLFRIPQCTTNNNLLQSAASNTNTTNYYQYESTIEMNMRNKNNRALSNLTTHYLGICLQPNEYCNYCILTQTLYSPVCDYSKRDWKDATISGCGGSLQARGALDHKRQGDHVLSGGINGK